MDNPKLRKTLIILGRFYGPRLYFARGVRRALFDRE